MTRSTSQHFVRLAVAACFAISLVACSKDSAPPPVEPQASAEAPAAAPPDRGADLSGSGQAPAPPVEAPEAAAFSADRLQQMVAPIALYPDPLLMQVLMAATYPAEVAEAAVWMKQHPGLNGKPLDDAIADKGWDVSVNSLCHATQALELMGADPAWTRDLGDAFLAQQDDVLNAVQVMRSQACDLGNLKTTEQQQVVIEDAPPRPAPAAGVRVVVPPPPRIVRIVPVQPEVVYVPVYNPMVIYGPPPPVVYYPHLYAYPSISVSVGPVISFGVGLAIGGFFFGDLDWDHHHFYSHRYGGGYYSGDRYYRDHYADHAEMWRHDYRHRRDVSYRSPSVANTYRYDGGGRPGRDSTPPGHQFTPPGHQGMPPGRAKGDNGRGGRDHATGRDGRGYDGGRGAPPGMQGGKPPKGNGHGGGGAKDYRGGQSGPRGGGKDYRGGGNAPHGGGGPQHGGGGSPQRGGGGSQHGGGGSQHGGGGPQHGGGGGQHGGGNDNKKGGGPGNHGGR